jgi:hypothetical protein
MMFTVIYSTTNYESFEVVTVVEKFGDETC